MADAPFDPRSQEPSAPALSAQAEPSQPVAPSVNGAPPQTVPQRSVVSKLLGLLLVIICFEIGVFLIAFPWMDAWGTSSIPAWSPALLDLWENNYFRGALSGLGIVNVWISFLEMLRLLRG